MVTGENVILEPVDAARGSLFDDCKDNRTDGYTSYVSNQRLHDNDILKKAPNLDCFKNMQGTKR